VFLLVDLEGLVALVVLVEVEEVDQEVVEDVLDP